MLANGPQEMVSLARNPAQGRAREEDAGSPPTGGATREEQDPVADRHRG